MKQTMLERLSVQELLERFVEICLAQDRAEIMGEHEKFKSQFREMVAIEHELKARAGDQRRALASLFGHANAQVRLNAAVAALAVVPDASRRALQGLWQSRRYPQAAEAGMTLKALEEGTFIPT